MTMRIAPGQMIGGVSAIKARDLLAQCRGAFRADWLEDKGYDLEQREVIIRELLALGYIEPSSEEHREPSPHPWYSVTDLGRSFSNALAARPITRAHAERTVAALKERIEQANRNPDFLFRVTEVVLYGSYLRGSESLGDIDIACRLEGKINGADGATLRDIYREHYHKSGRRWTGICCEFYWPREEVLLFLKNRQRSISLHEMDDFLTMEKDENFSYEVLLGDAAKIESELKEQAQKRAKGE
ncbi:hypothetical protein DYQ86_10450 [Acidobacteria bacterium AB60]|nr:hypothetical protein DYQ86_10450 [Acidobacteria bacterium AB60]